MSRLNPPFGPLGVKRESQPSPVTPGGVAQIRDGERVRTLGQFAPGLAPPGRLFDDVALDLSDDGWSDPQLQLRGYGVVYLNEGSSPDGRVTIDGAGRWTNMKPGDYFEGSFDQLVVRRGSRSSSSGTARLLILRDPGVRVSALDFSGTGGLLAGRTVAQNGNGQQAANSAAGNEPSGATDGVSLIGVKGFRVIVSANAGQTLTSGTIKLWNFSAGPGTESGAAVARSRWVKGVTEYDVADGAGLRDVQFPDEVISVSEGRLYAEGDTVITSAGDFYVFIETWG